MMKAPSLKMTELLVNLSRSSARRKPYRRKKLQSHWAEVTDTVAYSITKQIQLDYNAASVSLVFMY